MHETTAATATFLFTDIEGSTELLKSNRSEYAAILADHHRLLREQFTAFGGREIDNQGDSFFVAFTRAKDAVLAAAACQRALAGHAWPGGATVRVRMGIHTGEADLTVDRYVGLSVHRAARISALGHGGQVLVSPTTAGLLDDEEDLPGLALRSLGEHRLKDIPRPVQLYQLDIDGLQRDFPPLASEPLEPNRRRRLTVALLAVVLLAVGAVAVAALLLNGDAAPPKVLPNSLVRLDPKTLEPTNVYPVGDAPDLVRSSGGYVWVTHYVRSDGGSVTVRNAGDRTLTRVDPATGDVTVVGGVAPCGLTADPSGDVWVANCFAGGGRNANVVRIDATSLHFKETWPAPSHEGYFRGLAYGGGSLWISDALGLFDYPQPTVTRMDPETGKRHPIPIDGNAGAMAWSEGYGDLWMNDFPDGAVRRLDTSTERVESIPNVAVNPVSLAVDGDSVWVGDWSRAQVVRLPAVGPGKPHAVPLPGAPKNLPSYVWQIDAGAGGIWAAAPRLHAVFRIDPKTNAVTRIPIPYLPSGVAADDDAIWVTVRGDESG